MLPIIPGCKAIVINSVCGNNGKCVTVIEYEGIHPEYNSVDKDWWLIDTKLNSINAVTGDSLPKDYYASEKYLMRIDGGEFKEHFEDFIIRIYKEVMDKAISRVCNKGKGEER